MKRFLKAVSIIFIVILALCLLVGVAAFFILKNFDLNKFKPQVVAQVQQALGRQVQVGDLALGLSLPQGLSLGVRNVIIADDPQFSKNPFVAVDKLSLGLDILGVITQRQISISTVEIVHPQISLIRNEDGVFNFQSLAMLTKNGDSSASNKTSSAAPAIGVAAVLVKNIFLGDGTLTFEDHLDEDKILQLKKIDVRVSDFSLTDSFKVSLKAACLSEKQNVAISGSAMVDALHSAGVLRDLQGTVDLKAIDVKLVAGSFPAAAQAKLQNPLNGQLTWNADEIQVSAQGVAIKTLQGSLAEGELKTSYLKIPVKNIQARLKIVSNDLTVDSASCALGQGHVDLSAAISNYLSTQEYKFIISMEGVSLGPLINQGSQGASLEGTASGKSIIQGKGLASLAALNPDSGQATVHFQDGKLVNVNVLKIVLDKMSMLPNLSQQLTESLPEKYRTLLEKNDTDISAADFEMNIQQGQVTIQSAKVQTDVFSLTGQGTMDLKLNMSLATRIMIPTDLSKSMVSASKELKFLLNDEDQIVIPVAIEGKAPTHLTYMPDLEYLGKKFFETRGKEELGKLLDKVLDRGRTSDENSSSGSSSGEEIIGNVLDAIFKK